MCVAGQKGGMCVAGQQVCGQDMCSWLAGGVRIQGGDSKFKNITMVHCSVYIVQYMV